MAQYQVLARKYRPQSFDEVLGQSSIVTTLKNAIKMGRLAHAYLFCGSRGTGKTTLARVLAKALNCRNPSGDGDPCSQCSSCKEIASGHSLDVLEIDGASHRGIDDIRQINETVGYSSSSGKYKIYIIDEVHMLTKEAFNALLKTLEEPPGKVLFIFATTEPHKVLPTILSRCQRFNLSRIPLKQIMDKLARIANDLSIEIEQEALYLLAQRADGGLRDAESLFDQIIAFHEGRITVQIVADVLGIVPKDTLFALDFAGKEGKLSIAFEIAHQVFSQGKDITQFVESITEHFRTLLLIKISGIQAPFLNLSETDKPRYGASAKLYSQEQCLTILDFLIEAQNQIRFQASSKIALESILLRIMRTHQRLPVEFLVRRLTELEQAISESGKDVMKTSPTLPASSGPDLKKDSLSVAPPSIAATQPSSSTQEYGKTEKKEAIPAVTLTPIPAPIQPDLEVKSDLEVKNSVSVDPTPTPADLGIKKKSVSIDPSPTQADLGIQKNSVTVDPTPSFNDFKVPTPPSFPDNPPQHSPSPQATSVSKSALSHKPHRYDTLLQFAAVELEGTVQKHKLSL
jgi:DNA polymerase III subunit gamma/tau